MKKLSTVAATHLSLLLCFLSACSGPVESKPAAVTGSADYAEGLDAGPAPDDVGLTPCETQCEQVGALCDTLCTEESDSGTQIASCKSTCAMAVLTQCLPYCPGFNLVICIPGHGCGDGGMY
jgi:hypothetical protein